MRCAAERSATGFGKEGLTERLGKSISDLIQFEATFEKVQCLRADLWFSLNRHCVFIATNLTLLLHTRSQQVANPARGIDFAVGSIPEDGLPGIYALKPKLSRYR